MEVLINENSKLIGTYNSTGQRIKVVTILGEFVGIIRTIGGPSTVAGNGGINGSFKLEYDDGNLSDTIYLNHSLSISVAE